MTATTLALIGTAALIGPLGSLWKKWHIPTVVLEILAGLALGASWLGWLDANDPMFSFLAEDIGLALVMFVAGTHVPLTSPALRQGLLPGLARAALIGLLAVPTGLGVAHVFNTGHGWLYAVLIASSSSAVIMPILSDNARNSKPVASMIAQVAAADIACIVALPLAIAPAEAGRRLAGMALVVAVTVVIFFALSFAERRGLREEAHARSKDRALALELRVSLTLLFALVAIGQADGVSPMFSGFALGLAIRAIGEPKRLTKQLFAVTEGFFAPLFFVWLGASLTITDALRPPDMMVLGLTLGIVAVITHGLMALTRQRPAVATLTAAQLGVPSAAVALGTSAGIFLPGEAPTLLVGALVTIAAATVSAVRVNF